MDGYIFWIAWTCCLIFFGLFFPVKRWGVWLDSCSTTAPSDSRMIYKSKLTSVKLDGLQMNGMVYVIFYDDFLSINHFSPLKKSIYILYSDVRVSSTESLRFQDFLVLKGNHILSLRTNEAAKLESLSAKS